MAKRVSKKRKTVETLTHEEASRKNIPTAELESVVPEHHARPIEVTYERGAGGLDEEKSARNRDLDPQLVWRGKDEQDWSDLIVYAPPLYIQEKVHPKVLIDDLMRRTQQQEHEEAENAAPSLFPDLFADFNGLPNENARTEFYQHDANWTNRMILGDSLQVMASLTEREGLRGQVQCIYIDPPYGIKFNSNFQWSTTSRDVKDGNVEHITREPEQVKAFRDTWRDGIHSYLTYLRDRLTVARDLLTETGSIFVQIGDEHTHRVRALLDEVFGDENCCATIHYVTTSTQGRGLLPQVNDTILWYAKDSERVKYRNSVELKELGGTGSKGYNYAELQDGQTKRLSLSDLVDPDPSDNVRVFAASDLTSSHESLSEPISAFGKEFRSGHRYWSTSTVGMHRLRKANRLLVVGNSLRYKRYFDDFAVMPRTNVWTDTGVAGFTSDRKMYVVQTNEKVIQRCVLMATDPGDLVLDPTCGAGTTAAIAEQWGRRWITIDTSRVALALARARIMGARYPYYILADSMDGQLKEAELTHTTPSTQRVYGNIRHGFVYERVPHITLKSIANNAEIDVIWEKWQEALEPQRQTLNAAMKTKWEDWEIPREADTKWPDTTKKLHSDWWKARIARQRKIDASIAAKADFEFLFDKPYEDRSKVRVAGPFTVESLSPHRVMDVDENDELIDPQQAGPQPVADGDGFVEMILDNLKTAGVQQAHKEDKINFSSIKGWPGTFICAEGMFSDGKGGNETRRAGIFIGPEFGTVSRQDLVLAAREAGDAGFDVLIACAFNYDAHSSEFDKLGRVPVLKARMNADLHMADDLKNTGKGNLFVIFGEPDIDVLPVDSDDAEDSQIKVRINGVDVFHPNTGEVRSDGAEGIACWFIDTDYNGESFFVRHAYFLGASDPYKSLKTTLKAEINEDAWESLHSDTSRPFDKPAGGRIAVKVINHLGDEVMKVFRVE
ncbi:MAG: site-specific DNA-methyltransferase [Krumholzibacteria bacterium]|nr:site-specific DNA-methyltransferase [Candidatus Krumholzibacteria bacterium]